MAPVNHHESLHKFSRAIDRPGVVHPKQSPRLLSEVFRQRLVEPGAQSQGGIPPLIPASTAPATRNPSPLSSFSFATASNSVHQRLGHMKWVALVAVSVLLHRLVFSPTPVSKVVLPTAPPPGEQPVLSQDEIHYQAICELEQQAASFFPGVSSPPTLFGILQLDPYSPPFYPPSENTLRNGPLVTLAEDAIVKAWHRLSVLPARHYESSSNLDRDEAFRMYVDMAFLTLMDIDRRAIYTERFVAPSGDLHPVVQKQWLDRRKYLRRECGRFWPEK